MLSGKAEPHDDLALLAGEQIANVQGSGAFTVRSGRRPAIADDTNDRALARLPDLPVLLVDHFRMGG